MTQRKIKEYEIRGSGYSYIEDHLKNGNEISELLLRATRLSSGRITTYLPEGINERQLNNFDHAILPLPSQEKWVQAENAILIPVFGTEEYIAERICAFLGNRPNWVFLIEDIIADEGDAFLKNAKKRIAYTNKKVMYYTTGIDDKSETEKILRLADISYGGVGIIAAVPQTISLPLPEQLSKQSLEEISRQVTHMVFEAYDGDGYLWWEKTTEV